MASYSTNTNARWRTVPATSNTQSYDIFTEPIEKPALDEREYRLLRLQNGLQALLVHDEHADTSAAAMDIAVGHLSDPDDMPGLAHFCEHMLFLGTKQFPKENGYNEYIAAHGGVTNAYTSASTTNYYFSVSSTSTTPPQSGTSTPVTNGNGVIPVAPRRGPLPRALEMFASFFHSPLFSESGTARELKAVDSEHKKNSQNDSWRLHQLDKSLSGDIKDANGMVKRHPWSKFGTGHSGTLSAYGRGVAQSAKQNLKANGKVNGVAHHTNGVVIDPASPLPALPSEAEADGGPVGRETRRRLIEWWETEYCAGRMRLAIIGRESLDELTHLAVTLFSPILNRSQDPAPIITDSPLVPGNIVETKTVMDFQALDVTYSLPWQKPCYMSKPAGFIGHFVGHEGPGSLHSYLKDKGWCLNVRAGSNSLGRGFDKFGVTVGLTKEGLENYEKVLAAVYKYISLLQAAVFDKFYYEEIRAVADIHFKFAEKVAAEDYVSNLASAMNLPYKREHIVSAPTRVWEWDEGRVQKILEHLKPELSRVTVMAKEFKNDEGWRQEKWYGTPFRVRKIDERILREAQRPNDIPELFLPGPNAFIPTDLNVEKQVVAEASPTKAPVRLRETPLSTLWYKKDDQFWVPKGNFKVSAATPLANLTPRHSVRSLLYTRLVNDALTEYSYDAALAGLFYDCGNNDRGVYFSASGYNEKIPTLVKTVLETMKNIKIKAERFAVIKENLKQEYENFSFIDPYRISDFWADHLLSEKNWTPEELLAELKSITVEEVQVHAEELLSRVYIESLATGNLHEEEAISLLALTEKILRARPTASSERLSERSMLLPQGANFVWKSKVPNPKEVNSSLNYYIPVGNVAQRDLRAVNALLLHMMQEPAFDELRTKQQLGYITFLTYSEARGSFGLRFLLQSEREPVYLESRVEAFLEAYRKDLAATSPEQFEKQKEGLISKKLEKVENLYNETRRFWSHISNGYWDFLRNEKDVEVLREITLEDVIQFFDTYICPGSPQRRKLSVHLRSQCVPSTTSPRFSVAASEAYLTMLRDHGVPVEEKQYRELSKAEPPLEAVSAFWTDALSKTPDLENEDRDKLLSSIQDLASTYPAKGVELVGDGKAELGKDVVIIEDIPRYKARLTLGPSAVPVQ